MDADVGHWWNQSLLVMESRPAAAQDPLQNHTVVYNQDERNFSSQLRPISTEAKDKPNVLGRE